MHASDVPDLPAEQVQLGQLLFHDPVLSGNRNISCATFQSPEHSPSDGLPLDIGTSHIANAVAAFEATEFQSYDSPFDAYLAGNDTALDEDQTASMALFFGTAGCADRHAGPLFKDQRVHAIALPQFGPGRTRMWDAIMRDSGHMAVSDRIEDAYRSSTPSLRNVALTSPYGHTDTDPTLEGIVRHHLDPAAGFESWTPDMVRFPDIPWLAGEDLLPLQDRLERARLAAATDLEPRDLDTQEVTEIVALLHALTGTESIKGRPGRPARVLSGLEVD